MQRQASFALGGFLVVFWGVLSAVLLAKGGLYIAKHEGDTMHLVDMVLRQADGQWAHLDYMTPIGFLATAPIALFVSFGWGVGMATLASQVLVGAVLLLPIWWVGVSRFSTGWAMVFGAICLWLSLALVHGEPQPSISVSMHYNRWAWALAFLAIATAILTPVGRQNQVADGVVLGLAVAGMALIKVTYVAALLPAILVALLARRQWRAILVALLAGLAVIAVVTIFAGTGFWRAYIVDLLTVMTSDTRPQPGHAFEGVLVAPSYLGGSFAAIMSIVLLRQAGRATEGLAMLLLVPGFFYVTYQNFGNDPQWLYLLGVLLFVLRPEPGTTNASGWDMRQALTLAGCAVFMLGLPSALNLAFSPFRHLALDASEYEPMFWRSEQHGDLYVKTARNEDAKGSELRVIIETTGPEGRREKDEEAIRDERPAMLLGAALPDCELYRGTTSAFNGIAMDLEEKGYAGKTIVGADLLASYWLFGDFLPPEGGAGWRYDGLPGVANATHLIVPICPMDPNSRRDFLEDMEAAGFGLNEVERNDAYVLLEIGNAQ